MGVAAEVGCSPPPQQPRRPWRPQIPDDATWQRSLHLAPGQTRATCVDYSCRVLWRLVAELPVLDFRFSDPPRSTMMLKRLMDLAIPRDPAIDAYIAKQRPDVLAITPLIESRTGAVNTSPSGILRSPLHGTTPTPLERPLDGGKVLLTDEEVESLEKLKELTNYGKPLLSYHIQGAEDSQGLAELGLLEVQKGRRGKSIIKATTLGRLLTLGK